MTPEQTEICEQLIDMFNGEAENKKAFLINGSATDFAEYRHVAGRIRGLQDATELVKELLQIQEDT